MVSAVVAGIKRNGGKASTKSVVNENGSVTVFVRVINRFGTHDSISYCKTREDATKLANDLERYSDKS